MKQRWLACLALASLQYAAASAQHVLPQRDCFAFGGGIMTGIGNGNGDYMDVAGHPVCYLAEAGYKHYFVPYFALGANYDFITSKHGQDQLRCHFIAPTFTFRYLMDDNKHAFTITLGTGYFQYADRLYQNRYVSSTFNKGYFGLSADLGYEFVILPKASIGVKATFLMADWHFNPDYTPKFLRSDKDEFQSMFESNLLYASLSIVLQFGK